MTSDRIVERFADSIRGKSAEEIEVMALLSPAVHFAFYVTIRNKNNEVEQPIPNVLQLRMSEAYETMRRMKVKVRIIVVKPRRAGCSSFAEHIGYHHGQRFPIEGITVSDDKTSSAELMKKLKEYSVVDTFPWGNVMVQQSTHSVAWSNGTRWTIDTAQNPDAGVGNTMQFFHGSEVSKWPQTKTRNDKKAMAAILPALSGMDTVAIAESTPERAAGWQYSTWQVAVTLEQFIEMHAAGICPEEVWVKVFAAWFEFADNRRSQPVSEAEIAQIKRTLTDREQRGIDRYQWDWEQIAWRRDTISGVCNGDEKIFDFYYPEDDVSCWLAGGSPRFDMGSLVKMEARARANSPDVGELVMQDNGVVTFQPSRDGKGDIFVWEGPKEGCRYLVSVDPATDETQTIGADPDRHSVNVWRQGYHDSVSDTWKKPKKVARLRPPFYGDGDEVAGHVVRLSRWYGNAITSLEINMGYDILRLLRTAGVPLYKRKPLSHRTGEVQEQYGFKTGDKQERNALIEGLAAAIRNDEIEVYCLHTIDEYKLFVVNAKGRAEAASGAHDDDVMADAIAWETLPSATEYRKHVVRHMDPPDSHSWKRVTHGWRS